ncbi:unnamed protein product, partial [Litomosoides sigmodontis]
GTEGTEGTEVAEGTEGTKVAEGGEGVGREETEGTKGIKVAEGAEGLLTEGTEDTEGTEVAEGSEGLSTDGTEGAEGTMGKEGRDVGREGTEGLEIADKEGMGYKKTAAPVDWTTNRQDSLYTVRTGQSDIMYSRLKVSPSPLILMLTSQMPSTGGEKDEGKLKEIESGVKVVVERGRKKESGEVKASNSLASLHDVIYSSPYKGQAGLGSSAVSKETFYVVGEEGRAATPFNEIETAWWKALEVLKRQLRVFQRNVEQAVVGREKFPTAEQSEMSSNDSKAFYSGWYVAGRRHYEALEREAISNYVQYMMKFNRKIVEHGLKKSPFGTTINRLEVRRKALQIRRSTWLSKMVNDKEREKMKLMEKNGEDEELIYIRLLEESARLKEASFLRREEMRLRKQRHPHVGFICKIQLRRRKQIMQRLQQLAQTEREQYEELEDEWRMRITAYMAVSAGDNSSLDMKIANLLSSGYKFGKMRELKKLSPGWSINDTQYNETVQNRRWKWQKLMSRAVMNGTYVKEGREMKSKEESKREEELTRVGLMQEKDRLEEARLLRKEQMKLWSQQELHHGFVDKTQLKRHEEIIERLGQLAKEEKKYHEKLKREWRIREKIKDLLSSGHEEIENVEHLKMSSSWRVTEKYESLENETISKYVEYMMKLDNIAENSSHIWTLGTTMHHMKMRTKALRMLRRERLAKIANETYIEEEEEEEEEKKSDEGSVEEEELMFARLLSENARLKEALFLREEEMELSRQGQHHNRFAGKAQSEQREQIVKRLEQLLATEMAYREELQEEWQMKMKAYTTTSDSDSSSQCLNEIS